jgi:signal transduction protein with GAF and PtsI domain
MIDIAISSATDLQLTLRVIVDQVTHQLQVEAAAILLYNPVALTLEYAADRGFRVDAVERAALRVGSSLAGRAVRERRVIEVHNLKKDQLEYPLPEWLERESFTCYWGVPLIARGQIKGVLEIFTQKFVRKPP